MPSACARLRWRMDAEEAKALLGLDGGVCEETNPVYESLIGKGLASPEDGLVRASVAGEVVLDAMRNAELNPDLPVEAVLEEIPMDGNSKKIDDFF